MTKAQENTALNTAKENIRAEFHKMYGFSPSKKEIIPLEASYNTNPFLSKDFYFCESLGFRVGSIGYSYRMGEGLQKNDAYNA